MAKPPVVPEYIKQRFGVLKSAASNGDLCVIGMQVAPGHEEPKDTPGGHAWVVCAVNRDGQEISFVPIAEIVSCDNPYEAFIWPEPNGVE